MFIHDVPLGISGLPSPWCSFGVASLRLVWASVVDEVAHAVLDSVDHLPARGEMERFSVRDGRDAKYGEAV